MGSGVTVEINGTNGVVQLGNEWSQADAEWLAGCLVDVMVVDDAVYFKSAHAILVCRWDSYIDRAELESALRELLDELSEKKEPSKSAGLHVYGCLT